MFFLRGEASRNPVAEIIRYPFILTINTEEQFPYLEAYEACMPSSTRDPSNRGS